MRRSRSLPAPFAAIVDGLEEQATCLQIGAGLMGDEGRSGDSLFETEQTLSGPGPSSVMPLEAL